MAEKKLIYAEEYLAVHNKFLKEHHYYRPDMMFSQVDAQGNLVLKTHDKILSSIDEQIFNEIVENVSQYYKLIIP